jgi:HEAT repeat protein
MVMNTVADEDGTEYERRLAHFITMLKEEDPSRRWKAAEGLARMGDKQAVEPLVEALSDEDWRVRQKAAWALGQIGDPTAIRPLRHALLHEMEGVKEIIMEALDAIKRENV